MRVLSLSITIKFCLELTLLIGFENVRANNLRGSHSAILRYPSDAVITDPVRTHMKMRKLIVRKRKIHKQTAELESIMKWELNHESKE